MTQKKSFGNTLKTGMQDLGRSLSAMVMPNIGAFIAWGFIMALFIPNGWMPNEKLALLGDPMMKYLLPLLIGYTAGYNVHGIRGGVTGAIATAGVIVGSDVPMFIGAMIMGPLGGWCIKKFDKWTDGKVSEGFEMLVANFSIGIIAFFLAIIAYLLIGGAVEWLTQILKDAIEWLIARKLLPFVGVIVEPAKILFLNNAINHGIFDVLGVEQVQEIGSSIIFLIETNPGPGLGVLLACCFFGDKTERQSAPGAAIIHFFGGIHEIYFPYVLARPALILGPIVGSFCALMFFTLTGTGLVAPAAPGSVIALLAMAPKGKTLTVLAGILIATAVSFLVASPILKLSKKRAIPDQIEGIPAMPGTPAPAASGISAASSEAPKEISGNRTGLGITFVCDAGMGSSALAATSFRKKLASNGIEGVTCSNCAIEDIPSDASLVVCQKGLSDRVRSSRDDIEIIGIDNFIDDPALEALLRRLSSKPAAASFSLSPEDIRLGLASESRDEAILRAGDFLTERGYASEGYSAAMLQREMEATTCLGGGVAIPHGTSHARPLVRKTGVVVLQYPQGVDFNGEKVYLVFGIAASGDEHVAVLSDLASVLEDETRLAALVGASTAEEFLKEF